MAALGPAVTDSSKSERERRTKHDPNHRQAQYVRLEVNGALPPPALPVCIGDADGLIWHRARRRVRANVRNEGETDGVAQIATIAVYNAGMCVFVFRVKPYIYIIS